MVRFLKRIVLFAIGTLVFVLSLELILAVSSRVVHLPFPAASYDSKLVNRTSLHADMNPLFGIWHQPNFTARQTGACFDALFTTNRWGARDEDWPSNTNGPRGILLGDSFMEGYGVNEDDRASEVFEQKTGVKLLNLSTAGHCGPTQYRPIYASFKDSLKHDFVLVGLNLPNDLGDEDASQWTKRKRYRPYLEGQYPQYELAYHTVPLSRSVFAKKKTSQSLVKNILSEYSNVYHAATYILEQRPSVSTEPANGEGGAYSSGKEFTSRDQENAWKVIYNLEQIQMLAGSKPVVVFFVPNEDYVATRQQPVFDFFRARLRERNIRLLELNPILNRQFVDSGFMACDVHWNIAGNAWVGEALAGSFEQQLPSPHPGQAALK